MNFLSTAVQRANCWATRFEEKDSKELKELKDRKEMETCFFVPMCIFACFVNTG